MRPIRLSGLQTASVVYGVAYLAFALLAAIPATRHLIIADTHPEAVPLETALVELLFLVFLVGLVATWHSGLAAGLVFAVWYALLWWLDVFSRRYGAGGGGVAPVLGLPMFLVGIGFLGTWLARRHRVKSP